MKKIYEAIGTEKREIINVDNDYRAHKRQFYEKDLIGKEDLIMVGRTNKFPFNSSVDIHWSLNGLLMDNKTDYSNLGEFIIVEPFEEQISQNKLSNISEVDTWFNEPVELSRKAIILMPIKKYNDISKNAKLKNKIDNMNVRLYEGEEDLAVKMLFLDKNYIYLDVTKDGYSIEKDNRSDAIKYTKVLLEKQKQIAEEMQKNGQEVTYGKKSDFYNNKSAQEYIVEENLEGQVEKIQQHEEQLEDANYKMITGLTKEVEGDIKLDDELYGAIDIGKVRENQEDAVLLIKDKENPNFKMVVVADGMGGCEWRRNS